MALTHAQIFKQYVVLLIPLTGFLIGRKMDQMETERLVKFRDKSALYGRQLALGEKPSWP